MITQTIGTTGSAYLTSVTADNVRNRFRHLHVDNSGQTDRLFESLAAYLKRRERLGLTIPTYTPTCKA